MRVVSPVIAVLFAASFAISAVAQETPEPTARSGRLCIAAADAEEITAGVCRSTAGEVLAVEPEPGRRRWIWTQTEGPAMVMGTLAAGQSRIDLPSAKEPHVRFSVRLDPARASEHVDLRMELNGRGALPAEEPWRLPSLADGDERHLHIPEGTWKLTATSSGHLPLERKGITLRRSTLDLGRLDLERSPRVVLRVVDREGAPVAGAVLRNAVDEESLAVSTPIGEIEWESPAELLPTELMVEAGGYAEHSLEIRDRARDFIPPPVVLGRGADLTVTVERPPMEEPVDVILVRNFERRYPGDRRGRIVSEKTLDPDADEILFERIEPGIYAVHLRGDDPIERKAVPVGVAERETNEITIALDPFELEVTVLLGDQPLPQSVVTLGTPTSPGPEWKGKVITDHEGTAVATAWDRGIKTAYVESTTPEVAALRWITLEGVGDESIVITIDDLAVRGSVVDGETAEPLAKARVEVRWKSEKGAGVFSLTSDAQGRFERSGLPPGEYTLRVAEAEYLPWEQSFPLNTASPVGDVSIALERGQTLHLQVVDEEARPLSNSTLLELLRTEEMVTGAPGIWTAAPDGRVEFQIEPGSRRELWFVAPTGTFGRALVDSQTTGTPEAPHRLIAPMPAGSITIAALDSDGKPLSNVWLALQYSKLPIPPYVIQWIGRYRATVFRTGQDGTVTITGMPRGTYEWWGWRSDSDNVMFGVPASPARPADVSHYFAGGSARVVMVMKQGD